MIHDGQHLFDGFEAALDGVRCPARFLDADPHERLLQCVGALDEELFHDVQVGFFAAEVEHHHAADVGMGGVVGEGAHEHGQVFAGLAAATLVVRDCGHAIDIGILRCAEVLEFGEHGDLQRLMAGAHAGGRDEDKVACAYATVGAAIAEKCRQLLDGEVVWRSDGLVFINVANYGDFAAHVGRGYRVAQLNATRGADGLSVLANEFAGWDRPGCEAVAGCHLAADANHTIIGKLHVLAVCDRLLGYRDVVLRVHDDGEIAERRNR